MKTKTTKTLRLHILDFNGKKPPKLFPGIPDDWVSFDPACSRRQKILFSFQPPAFTQRHRQTLISHRPLGEGPGVEGRPHTRMTLSSHSVLCTPPSPLRLPPLIDWGDCDSPPARHIIRTCGFGRKEMHARAINRGPYMVVSPFFFQWKSIPMISRTVTQPESQLGNEISELLNSEVCYSRIVFVSAFVALRTILRLREQLLRHRQAGTVLRFTVGIDLGVTSRDVLKELLRWNCDTFVFHNTIARTTFHPKVYLFEAATTATLFVGSNNLTDGGFYSNYEAATRYDFDLPADAVEYQRLLRPLTPFLEPQGDNGSPLDADLIKTLVARGELPSEAESRQRRRTNPGAWPRCRSIPANPFAPVAIPLPPLLPQCLRAKEPAAPQATRQEDRSPCCRLYPTAGRLGLEKDGYQRVDALNVSAA